MKHLSGWGDTNNGNMNWPFSPVHFLEKDKDLLASILGERGRYTNAPELAERLIAKFGGLKNVIKANMADLRTVRGVNTRQIAAIAQTGQLLNAILRCNLAKEPALKNLEDVIWYCTNVLQDAEQEEFHCLFLNKSLRVIVHECLQIGTIDHVTVYPRELIKRALLHRASALILFHNHPSSNATPSKADILMTKHLGEVGSYLNIAVSDHIIVSEGGVFSFKQANML